MTSTAPLLVVDSGPVRRITMNRPQVHNAQNVAMLEAFDVELDRLRWSRDVHVVILEGAGRSFCSGHDLTEMANNDVYRQNASSAEGRYWQELRLFVEPVRKFRELPMPTICRVQGYCLAAGLMFAASADFAVAAEDAVFGSPIVADMAVNDAEVASFAYRVGERRAKQALWLGERLTAPEALAAGLVNWVVPAGELDAKCDDVVSRLAAAPPEVLALSKDTFTFLAERRGERDFQRYHYLSHQLSHHTDEARDRLDDRLRRIESGQSPIAKRDQ